MIWPHVPHDLLLCRKLRQEMIRMWNELEPMGHMGPLDTSSRHRLGAVREQCD